MEEWRKIKEHPNYSVSSCGRVRNDKTGRLLATHFDKDGYVRVSLSDKGKTVTVGVHRLVAVAFIPNPNNLPEVNHKDGDKTKNSANAIEWCTHAENAIHRSRALGKKVYPAEAMQANKKQIVCVEFGTVYGSIAEAAKAIGVTAASISACLRGVTKTCAGYQWKYYERSAEQ